MEPKKLWFRRKTYGYGWIPSTWQGWLSLAIYVALLAKLFFFADARSHSVSDTLIAYGVPFIVLSILFTALCYWKGEKPRWQWGKDK